MRCLRGHWDDEHDEGCIYTEREGEVKLKWKRGMRGDEHPAVLVVVVRVRIRIYSVMIIRPG